MIRALVDTVADLLIDLSARRTRVILMMTAVAFATGALTASVGIARMAERQVDTSLAASATDRLTITHAAVAAPADGKDAILPDTKAPSALFPDDALTHVADVDGVTDVGLHIPITTGAQATGVTGAVAAAVDLTGASSGYLQVIGATSSVAWLLDQPSTPGQSPVAIIGTDVATQIGVPSDTTDFAGYTVTINGDTYQVADVVHDRDLQTTVLIPYARAIAKAGSDYSAALELRTQPGAAHPVAKVVALAISPTHPDTLAVSHTADLTAIRTGVSTQLTRLVAAIGVLLVILTALLIANNMIVSVTARTQEIGMRRSLGASRGGIALLFFAEATLTGALGGAAGSALALVTIVVTALVSHWEAVLSTWYLLLGPAIGVIVAVVGTLHPAIRAARTPPATAVRAD